jgi:hypothetical protein
MGKSNRQRKMKDTAMNIRGGSPKRSKKRGPDGGLKLATGSDHASLLERERPCKRRRYSKSGDCLHEPDQLVMTLSTFFNHWLYKMKVCGDLHKQESKKSPVAIMESLLNMMLNETCEVYLKLYVTRSLKDIMPTLQNASYRLSAIEGALNAMKNTPSSLAVQTEACKILQRLVAPPGETLRNTPEAVNVLASALQHHPDEVNLQCLLLDLIRRVKPNHSDMSRETIVAIMETLKHHLDNSCVQQIGLSITAWLAEDDICRPILIEAGGLDSFPETMRHYPTDILIQCNAAAALCWLVHSGGHILALFQTRHVATILDTIEAHHDEAAVFGNCICILCGLVDLPDSPDLVRMVRMGMQTHIESIKVQESCLRWIRFRDPAVCGDELVQCVAVIVEAMQKHAHETDLQAHACEALSSLADASGEIRNCLLEIGAVDVVLRTLSEHRQDERTRRGATWVLTLLLSSGGTPIESVVAFGGGFEAIEILWGLPTEPQPREESNETEL